MVLNIIKTHVYSVVPTVAGQYLHGWAQHTEFGVCDARQGCSVSEGFVPDVNENGKWRVAQLRRVPFAILGSSLSAIGPYEKGEHEAEVDACFVYELILFIGESDRLLQATRSGCRRLIHDVILAG